jgi:hypothetical protein
MLRTLWLALLACLLAATADAAPTPLTDAHLALEAGALYTVAIPPASQPGLAGKLEVQRDVDGGPTRLDLPAGLFAATGYTVSYPADPAPLFPFRGFQLAFANASGALSRSGTGAGAAFGGVLPLSGP